MGATQYPDVAGVGAPYRFRHDMGGKLPTHDAVLVDDPGIN
jgi:hypothetical protein